LLLSNSHTVVGDGPEVLGGAESVSNVPREPLGQLFLRFLKFGSLAWGGPVAQIAMIRQELVAEEKWVTPQHFNRVLAMYQAGAVVLTIGIFLPAFASRPLAHEPLERFVSQPRIREFLEGVTAGVVGLIAGTTIALMFVSIVDLPTAAIFVLALAALFYFNSKMVIPLVVAAAGLAGFALSFTLK